MGQLVVDGVSATTEDGAVLQDLNFALEEGEAMAIVGTDQPGPEMVLRVIAGHLPASEGRVDFAGVNLLRRNVVEVAATGVVLASCRSVVPDLSIEENLQTASITGVGSIRSVVAATAAVLDLFPRLRAHRARPAATLPPGDQGLLALGRGLMARPSVLLIDRLSLALDDDALADLVEVLAQLREDLSISMLLAEPELQRVAPVVDRAIQLEDGVIAQRWEPGNLALGPGSSRSGRSSALGMR